MTEYEKLYNNVVKAIKNRFSVLKTQTECVLALYFGLTDNKKLTVDELVKMINDNGNKMTTGFVGTPYLLHVLSDNGYCETAYSLLLQEEYPSWLYEVNNGATTIWEHWDGIRDDGTLWSADMNSYNHYAYGSVVDWIYSVVAGIKPIEENPGYGEVTIAPVPDRRLGSINVSLDTRYGKIQSSWHYDGDTVYYEITTPVKATIIIAGEEHLLQPGLHVFEKLDCRK